MQSWSESIEDTLKADLQGMINCTSHLYWTLIGFHHQPHCPPSWPAPPLEAGKSLALWEPWWNSVEVCLWRCSVSWKTICSCGLKEGGRTSRGKNESKLMTICMLSLVWRLTCLHVSCRDLFTSVFESCDVNKVSPQGGKPLVDPGRCHRFRHHPCYWHTRYGTQNGAKVIYGNPLFVNS